MRLIDADALTMLLHDDIDGLDEEFPNDKQVKPYMCGVKMALSFIETAPTVDAVPRWIPCEERLPEKEKPYHRRDFYLTTNAYGAVNVTTYEFENDFQKRGWQSDIRIIAWMPLPEPYKGERKDDE